uniref:SFRICE_035041 n=1 Tax=Spodoptera frugiperda TaxID=7108 RepID=A0A2H1VR84_SPOFR
MESGKINLEKGQNQEPAPVPVPEPSTSKGSGHSKPSRPRRGRPTGANRTPLSLEERRSRNAQYERERREDLAQAQAELAEAAGCDPNVLAADLMAFVIKKLENAKEKQNIDVLLLANVAVDSNIIGGLMQVWYAETHFAQLEASRNAQAPPVVPLEPLPPAPPQSDKIKQDLDDLSSTIC